MSILEEIQEERSRQDAKWGEQNHPMVHLDEFYNASHYVTLAQGERHYCDRRFAEGTGSWELILNEEVAEAYEQAALGATEKLREELIQVAAVVVAMIECIDRGQKKC